MKKLLKWTAIYIAMDAIMFWSVMGIGGIFDAMNLLRGSEIKQMVTIFLGPWMAWTALAPFMQFAWWTCIGRKGRKTSKEETA